MKKSIMKTVKSFLVAFKGIGIAILEESHLRFHIVVAGYVLYFSGFYSFTAAEFSVIMLCILAVIGFEIINTAIERAIDLVCPQYDKLAGKAKDISAGAVLIASIVSVVIGITMFWDSNIFSEITLFFTENLMATVMLGVSVVLSVIFVVFCKRQRINNKPKGEL